MILYVYFWSGKNLQMYKVVVRDCYLEKYQLNLEENQGLTYFQTFGSDYDGLTYASEEGYKFEICEKCLYNLNSRLQENLCNLVNDVAKILVHLKLTVSA